MSRVEEFYHGSPENFKPGDVIKPPIQRGLENPRKDNPYYKPDRVYVTPFPHPVAVNYAWTKQDMESQTQTPSGYIYKVKPVGAKRNDEEALRRHKLPGLSYHFREAVVISKHHPMTMKEVTE
jgi:hypothetical protein